MSKGNLVLSRKQGERIIVGENREVVITVVEMRGNRVRISVGADESVAIHREEVFDSIQRGQE